VFSLSVYISILLREGNQYLVKPDIQMRLHADPIRGPALRAKKSDAQRRFFNNPERGTAQRAKISEAIKKVHEGPINGPTVKARMVYSEISSSEVNSVIAQF
jgi:hypothetical protein